ncbi:hypothetical protein KIW84_070935 [Lathyrus oleraceus]|uniref:Uncharacterized protein n=1 Tax=Pisum sativum TaxID=3888 RepID=A0A9D4VI63_PEA|nr:hypothetical protein KIW84_070935 [Pisum sativum]
MLFPASQSHANSAFLLAAARNSGWSISATMLPEIEPNYINKVDESSSVSSFLPEKLMQYLKDLSKFPTGGFDRFELLIAKAQLLWDNDINLPINDTDKRLSEVNEHTIHVVRIGDQTGTRDSKAANRSRRKPLLTEVLSIRKAWTTMIKCSKPGWKDIFWMNQTELGSEIRKKSPKACTVLLRGASKDLLNEVERNLQDAVSVARNMIKNPKLVPVGGAAGMTVSAALKQKSSYVEGIEKLPYEASACQIKIKKDHW